MKITPCRVPGEPELTLSCCGESGPVVLFLHGIGGNRSNWEPQLRHLGQRYRAVAADARGYGESDDYSGALSFSHFSDDICRILDVLDVQQAHLVGLSMGGRVALDYYGRFPKRVSSLTLADTSVGSADAQDPKKIDEFLALRLAPLQSGKTPVDIASTAVQPLLGESSAPQVKEQLLASLCALHKDSYMKTLTCVTRYHNFPAFESVSVPTLVIGGSEDKIARPEMVSAVAKAIPGARQVQIDRAGHISNLDQPEVFNRALQQFLDAQTADSAATMW